MKLNELPIGKEAIIKEIQGKGALRRHMLDMGLTPHTQVKIQKVAPMGDPIELTLRGYELTLRVDDAKNVIVQEVGK